MSIDSPSIPTASDQPKKNNCLMWGCLSVVILIVISCCCVGSLVVLPFVTDFDPFNLKDQIGDYINEFDDSSQFPGFDDFLDDEFDFDLEDDSSSWDEPDTDMPEAESNVSDAASIPMEYYSATDFSANFLVPVGWEIEVEEYAVTFYHPDSYTYLFVGEDLVDQGMTAEQVATEVTVSIRRESQEGTFNLISSTPWLVETGEDAYLSLMEWTDQDGYYNWAYDLEFLLGEKNTFFFISGEEPEEIALYGDLLEIIIDSFSRQ